MRQTEARARFEVDGQPMRDFLIILAAGCVLVSGAVWLRGQITYRVGKEFFRVMLFNFTLRKIPLSSITRVSTRLRAQGEHWANTFWPSHRQLVIHHKDRDRPLVVTPINRYVVKAELQRILGTAASDDETARVDRDDVEDMADEAAQDETARGTSAGN